MKHGQKGKVHYCPELFAEDDEVGAARAVDALARKLRGSEAHGGYTGGKEVGKGKLHRLNFPTPHEEAAAAGKFNRRSEFVGVTWSKRNKHWEATIAHGGKSLHLGLFPEEDEEAAAVVEAGPPLIVAAASELHPRRRLALGAPSPSPSSPTHPPAPPLVPLAEGACGRSHTLSLEEAWYQYLRALDLE